MFKPYNFSAFIILLTSIYLLAVSLYCSPSYAKNGEILIYIRDDVYQDYVAFVGDRDVLTISSFLGSNIRRDVVDMVIAQQALKLGGFKPNFKYASGKVNFRNTKMLQNGKLLISFDSYWLADAEAMSDKLFISDAVIRNGEYIAGIYTHPDNAKVLRIKKFEDLSELSAVSTPKWRTDWRTLEALNLKELVREDEWLSMARMVNLQWIDFLLMPFHSTDDKSFTMNKVHLVPVPNIGLVLKDSRHFVISKTHPFGSEAYEAMNKGLKKLRTEGKIRNAYIQAGFFVHEEEIEILNPE